jgi:hypothetical protein
MLMYLIVPSMLQLQTPTQQCLHIIDVKRSNLNECAFVRSYPYHIIFVNHTPCPIVSRLALLVTVVACRLWLFAPDDAEKLQTLPNIVLDKDARFVKW